MFSKIAVEINKKCVLLDEFKGKGEGERKKVLLNWRKTNECGEFGVGKEEIGENSYFINILLDFPETSINRTTGENFSRSQAGETSSSAQRITALFESCRDFCWKLARIIYRLERNKEILARLLFNLTRSSGGVANVL